MRKKSRFYARTKIDFRVCNPSLHSKHTTINKWLFIQNGHKMTLFCNLFILPVNSHLFCESRESVVKSVWRQRGASSHLQLTSECLHTAWVQYLFFVIHIKYSIFHTWSFFFFFVHLKRFTINTLPMHLQFPECLCFQWKAKNQEFTPGWENSWSRFFIVFFGLFVFCCCFFLFLVWWILCWCFSVVGPQNYHWVMK